MRTELFDYALPGELIAQQPLPQRDSARMLVADARGSSHHQVHELPGLLASGDLLILNHSRVFPARLHGRKASGGALEVLLVHREPDMEQERAVPAPARDAPADGERWQALVRGKVSVGTEIRFQESSCTVEAVHGDGTRCVRFPPGVAVLELAQAIGSVPLPPYIERAADAEDVQRYQTVYADTPGSVAAPTAGLHLTPPLLQELKRRGVHCARVELAIGPGTFKPVDCEDIEDFVIHAEHCHCPGQTVDAVRACQARGGRVIAIGTTALRTIETAARQIGGLAPYRGWTRLFLRPPERLQVISGLLTNFHLPRSSLLMAVSCLTGRERLQALYQQALDHRYRFLSYGDCMLWLPESAPR